MFTDIFAILPELTLFLVAMGLLMVGAFRNSVSLISMNWAAIGGLALAIIFSLIQSGAPLMAFQNTFIVNEFTHFIKIVIYFTVIIALLLSTGFMLKEKIARFEYPVLVLLAATGMGMMVSANDLIAMYLGIELQSLTLYVLAAIHRDSLRASEASMKYFVLGALSSGMLLYGCSLLYGFSGTTNFDLLATRISGSGADIPLSFIVGIIFVLAGLAFKISAVPFHMWTPDVYEGAPSPVTAFFAAAPKIAAMALLLRLLITAFPNALVAWQQIIVFLAITSMLLGAFSAIGQRNIKRLMAYSSIGHMGYALVGLSTGTVEGIAGVAIYMVIYGAMTLGAFACILAMRRDETLVEKIDDLAGLSRQQPFMSAALAILMFSLAGIPPLAGFFGKFYVFRAAIEAELYGLALIGVLASVVAAFYYLRIVKILYLDNTEDETLDKMPRDLSIIAGCMAGFALLFFVYPSVLVDIAYAAAQALITTDETIFAVLTLLW